MAARARSQALKTREKNKRLKEDEENPIVPIDLSYIAECKKCHRKIELIRRARTNGKIDDIYMKAGQNAGLAYRQVTYGRLWPIKVLDSGYLSRLRSGNWNNEPIDTEGAPHDVLQRGTVKLRNLQAPAIKSILCLNCRHKIFVREFVRSAI